MSDVSSGDPRAVLPLKPLVFQILLVLLGGERHGYSIVKEIERRAEAGTSVEPGNLYRTLRTMLAQGLIAESQGRPDPALDDQRRRYFRITDFGTRVAEAEASRLEALVVTARAHNLLGS
jgi:DNA-binding PadR family transcriptional regulator